MPDVATDYEFITDPAELVAAIAKLADERDALVGLIQRLTVRAVQMGALRYVVADAASISRPTLNAWVAEQENR